MTSIAIYSDDSTVRKSVIQALGKRLTPESAEHSICEFATADALRSHLSKGKKIDLFILDGEATPEGGMGIAKQLKDEVFNCPPVLLIVARAQDAWLAGWSRADSIISHPVDPFTVANKAGSLLSLRISS